MSTVLQVSLGFCTAFVFMGGIYMICPGGAVKKSISYLLGLSLILVLVLPLGRLGGVSFDFAEEQTAAADSTLAMSQAAAEYLCRAALDGAGINYEQVSVNTDILPDGSISITKITVVSGADRAGITAALGEIVSEELVETKNE